MVSWLKNAVFYEIYPQSFYDSNGDGIGDINGITQKLDYIVDLGFNALWINPCFESPFMDAGYDVSDYKKVAERYGTNEDLFNLFKEAKNRGVRVLLDLVAGHSSDKHEWFLKSGLPEKNEMSNRYIWTDSVWDYPEGFKVMSGMTDRDGNYIVNFFSSQPAINYGFNQRDYDWQKPPSHPDCVASKEALKDIMRFWMDNGADGFRVDMAYSLVKNDPGKVETQKIWNEIRQMFDENYPECALLSEWAVAEEAIPAGFHMDFYLHFHNDGYNALFTKKSYDYVDKGKKDLKCFFDEDGKGDITVFTEEYQRKYDKIKGQGFMCIPTGNHDMIRSSLGRTDLQIKLMQAFIMFMPGIPFVYYGDEIGMKYLELPSKEGGYFRTGSRTPMQWAKLKNLGFSTAKEENLYLPVDSSLSAPTVEEQSKDEDSVLNALKRTIAFKKTKKEFCSDSVYKVEYAKKGEYPFVFSRGNLFVAVNPSGKETRIELNRLKNKNALYHIGKKAYVENGYLICPSESLTVF